MINKRQKVILFDVVYGALILISLIELLKSGTVYIDDDAAFLTLSIAAAMLVVIVIRKEQDIFNKKIRHKHF